MNLLARLLRGTTEETKDLATLKLREAKLRARCEQYRFMLWSQPGKQDSFSRIRLAALEQQLEDLNKKIAEML